MLHMILIYFDVCEYNTWQFLLWIFLNVLGEQKSIQDVNEDEEVHEKWRDGHKYNTESDHSRWRK